ncbi:MAG TPA: hypothetical protein VFW09_06855 [Solirubrobacteraceae bacterium]|nr:hypothetical protein [Solirubrobacteraceae bacterium]
MRRFRGWLIGVVAVFALSACGGGSGNHSSTASPAKSTAGSSTSTTTSASSPGSSVTSGPVRATLHGANHAPRAGRPWRYVLTVRSASGRPLSGKVDVEFVLGSIVVGHDKPPVHQLRRGRLRESLTFPAAAVGHPIALQTVAHTSAGTVALRWPVTVHH